MHRLVEENLEEILQNETHPAQAHLSECVECRVEVAALRAQSNWLRSLRSSEELEPRPGFYARVMERIEAQGPASIWNLVFESAFGRRLAVASLALAMLMGVYLFSADQSAEEEYAAVQVEDGSGFIQNATEAVEVLPVPVISGQFVVMHDEAGVMSLGSPSDDSVLANLVTYREQ